MQKNKEDFKFEFIENKRSSHPEYIHTYNKNIYVFRILTMQKVESPNFEVSKSQELNF